MSERPRGAAAKKKHRPVVFFFAAAPTGLFTLTKKDSAACWQARLLCGGYVFASFASCLHRMLTLSLYPSFDPDFLVRARLWAVLTGEPTAGKSPTYSWLMSAFQDFLEAFPQYFPWLDETGVSHIYSRGTHAALNETLRDTEGVALCTNPEARTVLDPSFVNRLITDDKHYLNLSYLLETASGGSYEWVTATDLRRARAAREAARRRELEGREDEREDTSHDAFLSFRHTSINLCYFQQLSVLNSWWVPLEQKLFAWIQCSRPLFFRSAGLD